MRQGGQGQRQDVMYLGVAIGVLVVAFLIIVGARALSPKRAGAAPKKNPGEQAQADEKTPGEQAQADGKTPLKPKAKPKKSPLNIAELPPSSSSDPFYSQTGGPGSARHQSIPNRARSAWGGPANSRGAGGPSPAATVAPPQNTQPEMNLELIGVVQGSKPLAILRDGEARYYLRVGESVGDYRLSRIASNRVTVTRGGKSYTIDLQATKRSTSSGGGRRPTSRPVRRR